MGKPKLITKKKCTGCGVVKPVTFFYGDKRAPDGLLTKCRSCLAEARKKAGASKHTVLVRDVPCDGCYSAQHCGEEGLMCANFDHWVAWGLPNDKPKIPDRFV
jgi:hypothetical protein